jgi:hypothetical protein
MLHVRFDDGGLVFRWWSLSVRRQIIVSRIEYKRLKFEMKPGLCAATTDATMRNPHGPHTGVSVRFMWRIFRFATSHESSLWCATEQRLSIPETPSEDRVVNYYHFNFNSLKLKPEKRVGTVRERPTVPLRTSPAARTLRRFPFGVFRVCTIAIFDIFYCIEQSLRMSNEDEEEDKKLLDLNGIKREKSLYLDDLINAKDCANGIALSDDENPHELSVRDVCDIFDSIHEEEKLEEKITERSQGSFRRYDEYSSFNSRSSRKLACNDDDESRLTERTVKVPLCDSQGAIQEGGLTFYQQEPISEAEALDYYMQPEDFVRCDTDVKTSIVLWLKNKKGQGEFDEDFNTIRGLEELFDSMKHQNDNKGRHYARLQHVKLVMEEVYRQHRSYSDRQLDAEKIRQVSLKSSEEALQRAIFMGERDEAEAKTFRGSHDHQPITMPPLPVRVQSMPLPLPPLRARVQSMPLPDGSATSMAGRRGLLGLALPAAKVNETKSRRGSGFLGFRQKKKSDKS